MLCPLLSAPPAFSPLVPLVEYWLTRGVHSRQRHRRDGRNTEAGINHTQHGRHVAGFTNCSASWPYVAQGVVQQVAIAGDLIKPDVIVVKNSCQLRLLRCASGSSRRQTAVAFMDQRRKYHLGRDFGENSGRNPPVILHGAINISGAGIRP